MLRTFFVLTNQYPSNSVDDPNEPGHPVVNSGQRRDSDNPLGRNLAERQVRRPTRQQVRSPHGKTNREHSQRNDGRTVSLELAR
jgi:hypothetical protein